MSTSLLQSTALNARVVWALLLREVLTRYGRNNIGVLWMFVEPMIFTLLVSALWSVTKAYHLSSLPIVPFAVTGYSSVLLWRNMPSRCIGSIDPNRALLYHRNVKVADIFFSRIALEFAGATTSFFVLACFFIGIEWMGPPDDILLVMLAWLMLAWFGAALAILLASFNEETHLIERIWHPVSYIMFPLSGAAFLVSALPKNFQEFVLVLPMVHGTEALRHGYLGPAVDPVYDLGYMFTCNLVLSVLGFAKMRKISAGVTVE
jgi:ABC-type polysaccharide/polyol phosphate export permease